MFRFVRAVLPSLLIWALLGKAPAFSSTAQPLDLPEITKRADVIADVTVQNLSPYWASPAGVKAIHTRVDFSVNKMIKGAPASAISLDFLGGEVGGRGLRVPGVPKFARGERYIIFSEKPGQPFVSPILGLDQGALRVIRDNESNQDRVFRYWGQAVSEREDFTTRVPVETKTITRAYLRSADPVEHFTERVNRLLNQ